jgi:hypothetical protein
MNSFGPAALLGFGLGFLWGIGCALVIVYSIYLNGYRKAIKDSLKAVKPERYTEMFENVQERKARKLAKKKAKQEGAGIDDSTPTSEAQAGEGPKNDDLQVDETAQREHPQT